MRTLLLLLSGALLAAASPPAQSDVTVHLTGLRSEKGAVLLCLTRDSRRFLKCQEAPGSVGKSVPAGHAARVTLGQVPAGQYALLVVHDENRNGRFDMTLGIPREGFGFSNNPAMRPRPPRWEEIRFELKPGQAVQTIRVRYVL